MVKYCKRPTVFTLSSVKQTNDSVITSRYEEIPV